MINSYTKNKIQILLTLLLLVLLVNQISASEISIHFFTFKSDKIGKTYLEVYLSIPNSQLQFVRQDDDFQSHVYCRIGLRDGSGEEIINREFEDTFSTGDFHNTIDPEVHNVIKFPFHVDPGKYRVVVFARDVNKNKSVQFIEELEIPGYYSDTMEISSIRISNAGADARRIQPLTTFSFLNPEMVIYFESYNMGNDWNKELRTECALINQNGIEVLKFSEDKIVHGNDVAFSLPFYVYDVPGGNYKLQVRQTDLSDNNHILGSTPVTVIQSPLDLKFKDYDTALNEIEYILTDDEYDEMFRIPENQRQKVLNDFWKSKDPTPETSENEMMYEYYKRLSEASRFFTVAGIPGWKTDFGFVWVLFGRPNHIIRHRKHGKFEERHVWRYAKLDLSFTFVNWFNYTNFKLLDKQYIAANYLPKN